MGSIPNACRSCRKCCAMCLVDLRIRTYWYLWQGNSCLETYLEAYVVLRLLVFVTISYIFATALVCEDKEDDAHLPSVFS